MIRGPRRRLGLWLLFAVAVATGARADRLGGDFTLTADTGSALSLHDLRGKVVLLAFGYTHCPDICPTTLAQLAQVLRELGNRAGSVQVLFVTLDPPRDTVDHLHGYVRHFDQRFVGLTGSIEAIHEVARDYGVRHAMYGDENSALTYSLEHSTDLYVIDHQGGLTAILPYGTPVSRIAEVVRNLLPDS